MGANSKVKSTVAVSPACTDRLDRRLVADVLDPDGDLTGCHVVETEPPLLIRERPLGRAADENLRLHDGLVRRRIGHAPRHGRLLRQGRTGSGEQRDQRQSADLVPNVYTFHGTLTPEK